MEAVFDVCDFDLIYNDEFSYCVPEKLIRSYYQGTEFGRVNTYSEDESKRLREDIHKIYWNVVNACDGGDPIAVISAGAPGAGKTTLMERLLKQEKTKVAYCDPDAVCLQLMNRTWRAELEKRLEEVADTPEDALFWIEKEVHQDMYNKWRPASNAANHLILAHFIRQKMPFYFGTCSASPHAANTFSYLKEQGYKIHLIHVMAPDDVRWQSIQVRDRSFVQTTEKDICEKGKMIPQRIHDTYLAFADQIDFYYRGKVSEEAVLVATWVKESEEISVHDKPAYEKLVTLHDQMARELGDDELLWKNSVLKYHFVEQDKEI